MKPIISLFVALIFFITINLPAQIPFVEWSKNYGGTAADFLGCAIKTSDGHLLMGGNSSSNDIDVPGRYGLDDGFIMKTDVQGEIIWAKNYGGTKLERINAFHEDEEGNVWVAGTSASSDFDVAANNGDLDYWLFKIDLDGEILWEKNFGGSSWEQLATMTFTSDGGIILGGRSFSSDLDVSGNYGSGDVWIIKVDTDGNTLWSQNYGGTADDFVELIVETSDGNLVVAAHSFSTDQDLTANNGDDDYWIFKMNQEGEILWSQERGGTWEDIPYDIEETADGSIYIIGKYWNAIEETGFDVWLTKFTESGEFLWEKTLGGSSSDEGFSIVEAEDGNLILACLSYSDDGDVSVHYGTRDGWLCKVNPEGDIIWEQTLGGGLQDLFSDIIPVGNKHYLTVGMSTSTDIDLSNNYGDWDFWAMLLRELSYSITAAAFHDTNDNGVWDEEENALYNQTFSVQPNEVAELANGDGSNSFFVDPGSYTLSYQETHPLWTLGNAAGSHQIEVTGEFADTIIYFPLVPTADVSALELDLTNSITRCFREAKFWLSYENKGTASSSGTVSLTPDDLTTFIDAEPEVDSIAGNTLFWFYEDLAASQANQIEMIFEMPDEASLGQEMDFLAEIWEADGVVGDVFSTAPKIVCAYDPNDKQVQPFGYGEENYTLFEDSLIYTIRFQNTGNDTAFNIVIRDTLSDDLDIETFEFISSSHQVRTSLNEDARLLEFYFDDILLPDSFVNETASHGYVKFEIEEKANLAENTMIENTAGIYFDFNPPIITNTIVSTMVSELPVLGGIEAENERNQLFTVYPNPLATELNIGWEGSPEFEIEIFDLQGKLVHKASNKRVLDLSHLKAASYLIKVLDQQTQEYAVERILIAK